MNEHIKLVYTVEQMITREITERKVFYQKSKADVQLFLDCFGHQPQSRILKQSIIFNKEGNCPLDNPGGVMKEGLILCVLSKTSHLNEAKPQFATRLSRIIEQKHYLTTSLNGNLFYNHISMQAQANYDWISASLYPADRCPSVPHLDSKLIICEPVEWTSRGTFADSKSSY